MIFNKLINLILEGYNPYTSNPFDNLEGRVLIFFDTETSGLNMKTNQVTEIAGIAIDSDSGEELGEYHETIYLHDKTKELAKQGYEDVTIALRVNRYDPDKATMDEQQALNGFIQFVQQFDNPILVAHNASFDMEVIMKSVPGHPLKSLKVYDTMMFVKLHFIPTLHALAADGDQKAQQMVNQLTKLARDGSKRLTDVGQPKLSGRLGDTAGALDINADNWHSAIGDVKMLAAIFDKLRVYFQDDNIKDHPEYQKAYRHQGRTLNQYKKGEIPYYKT